MSSLAGNSYFDSGPHRFTTRTLGSLVVPPLTIDFLQTHHTALGTLQLVVEQRGRLIATSWDALWDQVETIRSAAETRVLGTLIDNHGRAWSNMTIVRFNPDNQVDVGRVYSLAYRVDYIRF
ncbi:MAG: hypothetical protein ACYTF7_05935 [Planctomycetota bacterium]|jgi:hypothetical protein